MNNIHEILRKFQNKNEPTQNENYFTDILPKPTFFNTHDIVDRILNTNENSEPARPLNNIVKKKLPKLSSKGLPTDSNNYWWVRYPKRAISEIEKMNKSTNAAYKCVGRKLIWDEVIKNNFKTQFYISIETVDYPQKMPAVYIKESEIKFKRNKHMFKGGKMCLMHQDDYNSKISILEIRNMACAWCWAVEVYTHTNKWPTAEAD